MPNQVGNKFKFQLMSGNIDFDIDTFKVILLATGQTFDIDADHFYSDVSAKELSNGNGYVTGGATLAGVTVTENDTNDRCDVAWNDVTWTASGGSIGPSPMALIYKDTGVAGTSTVVMAIDFSVDKTATDGEDFKLTTPGMQIS